MTLKVFPKIVAVVLMGFVFSGKGFAAENAACKKIKLEKSPAAYLVDDAGHQIQGPLDLGEIAMPKDFMAERHLLPTLYKLYVYPESLKVYEINSSKVELRRIKQACPGVAVYSINTLWDFKAGDVRPYAFNFSIANIFQDPETGYQVEVEYKFDSTVKGTLVERVK